MIIIPHLERFHVGISFQNDLQSDWGTFETVHFITMEIKDLCKPHSVVSESSMIEEYVVVPPEQEHLASIIYIEARIQDDVELEDLGLVSLYMKKRQFP